MSFAANLESVSAKIFPRECPAKFLLAFSVGPLHCRIARAPILLPVRPCMIVPVIKGGYRKKGPKIITYRNYTNFCAEDFRKDLGDKITSELQDNEDYGAFDAVVTNTLNKHAPLKKKYLRANDGPFMTKASRKAMMHRKKLRNRYIRSRTEDNLNPISPGRFETVNAWGGWNPPPPLFISVVA